MTVLKLDWCDHKAATYAVEHWHYSHRMPIGKLVKVGVWEDGQFIGVVLFGRGSNPSIGREYGLKQTEVCELVRVALTDHVTPVSRIVSIAIKMLQKLSPLRMIISYADSNQGHHGGIYQAMNWVYTGQTERSIEYFHNGRWKHNREMTSGAFGKKRKVANYTELPKRVNVGKYRYLYPLDNAMREQIKSLAKPYPKRENAGEAK